ncbi:MAG: alpha-ketoacid dehydrogenase subunit beta [Desulfovibrionaceae bacterium]|nr:alpha-ketoacid dehydrogenase subunit beta [Desulfovibrionaceae bacterium]MDD4951120.1 alpha-ketoacid dehydrogenase subunit beta [Desulfovibrionaceae bacterium]
MTKGTFGQAINSALDTALALDKRVFVAGEGVGVSIHADPNMPTSGLLAKYGPERVKDTPVSEAAIMGLAVGAAAMGLLPVVEIMFFPFITLASDMLVNHAAKLRYLSGGKTSFPLTVRVKAGVNFSAGCQHSHNLEAWLAHCPGLKVAFPSNPADAKGLLLSAIFDPNPVVVVEEMPLYWTTGQYPKGDQRAPLGRAEVVRAGRECTVVAYGSAVHTALAAAEGLAQKGLSVEVLDLRCLAPLDREAVLGSVRKTGRLVVVHDANKTCGLGAEIAALAAEQAFESLKAPVRRVAAPDIPVPFSPPQERFNRPDARAVAEAVESLV